MQCYRYTQRREEHRRLETAADWLEDVNGESQKFTWLQRIYKTMDRTELE
jgi:hypothetical protein